MPDFQTLLYKIENNVCTITLNRPDVYNAINEQMKKELPDALKNVEKDSSARCVVLRGAGEKAFCSGQDLKEHSGSKRSLKESLEKSYNPIILKLRTIEKPFIAMLNGVAAGAGCSLALACDMRFMSSNAKLIQVFVRIGLIPDSGSNWFLPRLTGIARAFEYTATGRDILAEEAEHVGLVNKVFPPEQLESETYSFAKKLAQAPTKTIGLIKRTLNKSINSTLDELLGYEAMIQEIASGTEDYKEGVQAFLEKRPAQFQGK
jgi:2-(1,2-epoxy-1,2-dihydrophenyl)acetyl-CoA isomerase